MIDLTNNKAGSQRNRQDNPARLTWCLLFSFVELISVLVAPGVKLQLSWTSAWQSNNLDLYICRLSSSTRSLIPFHTPEHSFNGWQKHSRNVWVICWHFMHSASLRFSNWLYNQHICFESVFKCKTVYICTHIYIHTHTLSFIHSYLKINKSSRVMGLTYNATSGSCVTHWLY